MEVKLADLSFHCERFCAYYDTDVSYSGLLDLLLSIKSFWFTSSKEQSFYDQVKTYFKDQSIWSNTIKTIMDLFLSL